MEFKPRAGQDGFGLGSQGEREQVSGQRLSVSRVSGREEEDLKEASVQRAEVGGKHWLRNQALQKLGPRSSLSGLLIDFGFDLQRNRELSKNFRQGR